MTAIASKGQTAYRNDSRLLPSPAEQHLAIKHHMKTKIRLLNAYIFPVLLYGAETWSLAIIYPQNSRRSSMHANSGAENWLLRICHLQQITNAEVLSRTNHTQISAVLRGRRLYGCLGMLPDQTGSWTTRERCAVISGLPSHWRRPPGRP